MLLSSGTELLNPFKILEEVGIRERMHVADLGSGSLGHFVFPAAQMVGPKGRVYAVDILREVLEIVERRGSLHQFSNVKTVWSDIEVYRATRIPESSLDLTLLVNNMFLAKNKDRLVKEMARLTKRGGRAVVIDWKPAASPVGPPTVDRVSDTDVKKLFHNKEFEFERMFVPGKFHYGLVFKRTDAKHMPPVRGK